MLQLDVRNVGCKHTPHTSPSPHTPYVSIQPSAISHQLEGGISLMARVKSSTRKRSLAKHRQVITFRHLFAQHDPGKPLELTANSCLRSIPKEMLTIRQLAIAN